MTTQNLIKYRKVHEEEVVPTQMAHVSVPKTIIQGVCPLLHMSDPETALDPVLSFRRGRLTDETT